jgi:pimeloyl-ACP methyl ester carboxylesterase
VTGYLDVAADEGAKVLTGGRGEGWSVRPTVLVDVTQQMRVCREEIFGPVVVVQPFDTEDEGVVLAKDSPYGLNAMVFTENLRRGHRVAARLRAGTVWVNLVQAARDGTGRGAVPDLLDGGPDEVPDRYRIASPLELVPLGLPTVLVHGDADESVPVEQSRRYAQVAKAAGDPVELVELPGVGHREVIDPASHAWRDVDRRLRRWAAC